MYSRDLAIAQNIATTWTSGIITLNQSQMFSITLLYAGANPVGTIWLDVSNHHTDDITKIDDFQPYYNSDRPVPAADRDSNKTDVYEYSNFPYKYVRIKFIPTGGCVGTLTAKLYCPNTGA